MKMKKLLSIGALGIVLACSTSVGASAATIPSISNADLIKIIANQSGVKKDTQVGKVIKEINKEFSSGTLINIILTKLGESKDLTVADVVGKINVVNFPILKNDLIDIATEIQVKDTTKNGAERIKAEERIVNIIKAYNSDLTVTFGKDSDGKTTISLSDKKELRPLIQLNSDDLLDLINNLDLNSIGQLSN